MSTPTTETETPTATATPAVQARPAPARRIVVQYPAPAVDDGRYPAKRCVGDRVTVEADVFRDGHELIRATVRYRGPGEEQWREAELHRIDAHLGGVRWAGEFAVDRPGRWLYTIEAWTDLFGTWRDELARKVQARQHHLSGELSEGVVLLNAGRTASRIDRRSEADRARRARARGSRRARQRQARRRARRGVVRRRERYQPRHGRLEIDRPLAIEVDRLRARFGAWYELFPRSWGGLRGVERQLPRLAELGFDVVYLPPIHPIGLTNRKGRNNSLTATPADPGSPWAIGDAGRRPRRDPPGARHGRRSALADRRPRASTGSTSRSTSRSSARPTTRG